MQNKKKSKDIQTKNQSRSKYQCPEALKRIIELVRVIPPDADLPDFEKVYQRFMADFNQRPDIEEIYKHIEEIYNQQENRKIIEYDGSNKSEWAIRGVFYIKAIDECLWQLPDKLNQYILTKASNRARKWFLVKRDINSVISLPICKVIEYKIFRELRRDLRQIVNYFERRRKGNFFPVSSSKFYSADGMPFELPQVRQVNQIEYSNNKFHMAQTEEAVLADAINNVDGDRIRACEICNHVFWANRKDSETCSPMCFNTLRQRRHRERNKEEINCKRRENYQYKKGKKKNDTY